MKRRRNHGKLDDMELPVNKSRLDAEPRSSSKGTDALFEVEREEDSFDQQGVFESLLTALASGSSKRNWLNKKRKQSQDDFSDVDDEENDSIGTLEEADDEGDNEGDEVEHSVLTDAMDKSEEDESVDELESSEDVEHDLEGMLDVESGTEIESSFVLHLARILSNEEVDELMKRKWKFKWDKPASEIPMSKWVGTNEHFLKDSSNQRYYGLEEKLYNHWCEKRNNSKFGELHLSMDGSFFSLFSSYQDVMHCNKKPFYLKGQNEDSAIMDAYIMHSLNHIYRTRDIVTKNGAKLTKQLDNSNKDESLHDGCFLDHGFTRPKVLILLPLGSIAFRVVNRLIQLTPLSKKTNVAHFDRFCNDFGVDKTEGEDEENVFPKSQKTAKPADHEVLFGGNNNDHFMVGIKITKRSIKLFSDFYSSDIIVASPLGLITKIGEAEVEKEKDVDYLSSIELLVIDHADIIAMQNWSHVNTVVEQLNRIPSKQHGTDVMRIRPWYLNGHARFYRQTLLLSSFINPDMNALFNRLCFNYEGKVKLTSQYKGVLSRVVLPVRQVYQRVNVNLIEEADDARLDYFSKKIFPKLKDSLEGGIMLFISSYFEFVRVRNFLKSQNASFCLLGEYTKPSDISRARIWFFEGKRKIMLYTERSLFYHRYKIRGIKNLIFYSLPERKEFYAEVMNMLDGSADAGCTVLFSSFDHFRLERIVGNPAAKRMISSDKDVFVFC